MKKWIIGLSVVLVIGIAGLSVYGGMEFTKDVHKKPEDGELISLSSAEKTIKYQNQTLTYVESDTSAEDDVLNIYEDDEGNEYRFDRYGSLRLFLPAEEKSRSETPATEEELIALCEKRLKALYEDAENYRFEKISHQANGECLVSFADYCGEGDFIVRSEKIFVTDGSGTLKNAIDTNWPERKDFDESLLKGITRSQLEQWVKDRMGETRYEMDRIQLWCEDGTYSINIGLVCYDASETISTTTLYYPLS